MTREEAQFILSAYRPNGEDAHDPQFEVALALVRQDASLAQWFALEQAIDRAFAIKLKSRPIAADLKAQLLLARTTGVCTPRWRRPAWIGVAASIVVLFILGGNLIMRRNRAVALAEFRSAMEAAALDMSAHTDVMGLDARGFGQWLTEHRGETNFVLPPALASQGIVGCKIVEWRQHRVTMLCFKNSTRHVDLFIVDEAGLPGLAITDEPVLFADGALTEAAWRHAGRIYLLAGSLATAEIQQLL